LSACGRRAHRQRERKSRNDELFKRHDTPPQRGLGYQCRSVLLPRRMPDRPPHDRMEGNFGATARRAVFRVISLKRGAPNLPV